LNSGCVPYCTNTSISESPAAAGVIWVGTDDGKVHVTRDHGATWSDLTSAAAVAGGPADRCVSRVFASPRDAGTAFVAKNGFRNDDFRPFLYRTTDCGRTWVSIAGNLAGSPINVVVQDRKNRNLLFVGNDLGVWISIDSGGEWTPLKADLPTVPVHDLAIHPRENDLVIGTYGRGVFIGDITPLQELDAGVLSKAFHLFQVEPRAGYGFRALGNFHLFGHRYIRGEQIAQLERPSKAGLNRVLWNMRPSAGSGRGPWPASGRGERGAALPAAEYRITVDVGGQQQIVIGRIRDRIVN
jgi:hypothetical protein